MLETAIPYKPSMSTDRDLGRTPRPPRLVSPGRFGKCRPLRAVHEHRPPPGQDPPSSRAGEPGPLGTAATRTSFMSTDQRLGRTPCPSPRPVNPSRWKLPYPTGPS